MEERSKRDEEIGGRKGVVAGPKETGRATDLAEGKAERRHEVVDRGELGGKNLMAATAPTG